MFPIADTISSRSAPIPAAQEKTRTSGTFYGMEDITLMLAVWAALLAVLMLVLFPSKQQDKSEDE
jgi:hypothetical protein